MTLWLEHPELDGQLEQLWRDGAKTREIARILSAKTSLDISRDAVVGRARRLKLGDHPTPPFRPKPKPVPEAEVEVDPVSIEAITATQCRWPVANEGRALLFCGRTRDTTGPYCARCRKLAYTRKEKG